ncbi:hypothetical protein Q8A73_015360 [Channa argus]|nr:hypothetical protein Q8A73_015360 [Channa argus]
MGGLKHETLLQRVDVKEGPGRGTTHAGADATETSCQLVETEHGLKVGIFPKGKLPPTHPGVNPRLYIMQAQKHRGVPVGPFS